MHGQSADPGAIFRGTNSGKTVSLLRQRSGSAAIDGPKSILGQLEKQGYSVFPAGGSDAREDRRFGGGYIVQTYGSHQPSGIDAIQIEFGTKLRGKDRLDQTVADLAAAIQAFAKEYLPETQRPAKTATRKAH